MSDEREEPQDAVEQQEQPEEAAVDDLDVEGEDGDDVKGGYGFTQAWPTKYTGLK